MRTSTSSNAEACAASSTARRDGWASTAWRSPRPIRSRLRPSASPPSWRTAITAPWTGSQETAARRGDPRDAVAGGALHRHARHELRPGARSARRAVASATAARSRSMRRTATITTSSRASSRSWPARSPRSSGADVKVFVDTAPVMEKPLAAAAGLGWQGKHTNLVSREFGSWLFLGSIFTTAELEPDAAGGRPLRLLPGLPRHLPDRRLSGALPARCAALHFLPHHREQGADSARFRAAIGNRIYGCDDCLAVCPWNKFAQQASEAKLVARDDLQDPAARRSAHARRCGLPDAVLRLADQAHRPRPLPAQRADRRRQFRRCRR